MDKKKKPSSTVPAANKKQVTAKTHVKDTNKTPATTTNSTKPATKPASSSAVKSTSNRSQVNTGQSKGGIKSADKKSRLTAGVHKNQNLTQQKDGLAFEVSIRDENAGMERPSSAGPSRLQQKKQPQRRMSTAVMLSEQQRLADERRQVYETERLKRIQERTRGGQSKDD